MTTELGDVAKASARSSFFLFLGKISSMLILGFASILIARLLGPEDYGIYTLALTAPAFLISLSDLGISPALTRFSARFHSEGKHPQVAWLIRAGFTFKIVFTLLLSLVLVLFSESFATWILGRPGIGLLVGFASICLVGQMIFDTLDSVLIGLDEAKKIGLLMNLQAIIKISASTLLIILGMGAIGAILGQGISFLLAAVIGLVLLLHIHYSPHRGKGGENDSFLSGMRLMIAYGAPLYLSTILFSTLPPYRTLLLAHYVSNEKIGNYGIALNFAALVTIISYPIARAFFPAFSKLSIEKNRSGVEKAFKVSIKYTSLLMIPASLATTVLAKEAVNTLYGSQYSDAPSYLALYVLGFLGTALGDFVIGNFLNGQGETRTSLKINLVNLSLSIPLTFVFTSQFGVLGLIGSIIISQFLSLAFGLFLIWRKYAVTVDLVSSIKIIVASAFSALPVYIFILFVPVSVSIFKLVAGAILYVSCFLTFAPLLGAFSIDDINSLEWALKDLPLVSWLAKRIFTLERKIIAVSFR